MSNAALRKIPIYSHIWVKFNLNDTYILKGSFKELVTVWLTIGGTYAQSQDDEE